MNRMSRPSPALLRLLAAAPALIGAVHAHAADEPAARKEEKIQQVEIKGAAAGYDAD